MASGLAERKETARTGILVKRFVEGRAFGIYYRAVNASSGVGPQFADHVVGNLPTVLHFDGLGRDESLRQSHAPAARVLSSPSDPVRLDVHADRKSM